MKPVLVLGATGLTGRLVVESLGRLGHPCVLAGRDPDRLAELARGLPHVVDLRLFDVATVRASADLFAGVGAVVNTVGPFADHGVEVVAAAIEAGAHYVDTSGEQSFIKDVYLRTHRVAEEAHVTVLPGHGFEYALALAGAAVLEKRCGPLLSLATMTRLEAFRTSAGTRRSALASLATAGAFCRERQLVAMPMPVTAERQHMPGEPAPLACVPIAGGAVILAPADIESLREVTTWLTLPSRRADAAAVLMWLAARLGPRLGRRGLRMLARAALAGHRDPDAEARSRARWTVWVRAGSMSGVHVCRMRGRDVYGISGEVTALAAALLASGEGRAHGVHGVGAVFDPEQFLDALRPAGLRWELR
jgi:short subunit dehydrogenase-like uncharacterized protein